MLQVGLEFITPAYPLNNTDVHVRVPEVTLIVGGKYIFM